jgi:hypothetical protein
MGDPRKSLFGNAGMVAAEQWFATAHPGAADYLAQAPILAMWAVPWASTLERDAETFARACIHGWCEDRLKLGAVIKNAGFTGPMRHLKASVIRPGMAATFRMLARIEPTVVARAMPAASKEQRRWLAALQGWLRRLSRSWPANGEVLFAWCVERFADSTVTADEVKDFSDFHWSGAPFNPAWGLKRAREEMDLWHRRITLESQLRGMPFGADTVIDMGDHPDAVTVDKFSITALRTPRAIANEGSAMRHCVATYIKAAFDGVSHIVSITENDRRVATLELAGPKWPTQQRWRVRQLRGPRNGAVRPTITAMADFYSELLRSRPSPSQEEG